MPVRAQGLLLGVLCLAHAEAALADTLRCGMELVASGDATYVVRSRCGEPDEQQRRTEVRTVQRWQSGPCTTPQGKETRCGHSVQDSVEVVIEEWLYDFGPLNFMQRVIFEQGRLIAVVPGARGSKQSKPAKPKVSETSASDAGPPPARSAKPWWAR